MWACQDLRCCLFELLLLAIKYEKSFTTRVISSGCLFRDQLLAMNPIRSFVRHAIKGLKSYTSFVNKLSSSAGTSWCSFIPEETL